MQQIQKAAIYCGAILLLSFGQNSAGLAQTSNNPQETKTETHSEPKEIENDKLPPCLAEISRATMIEDATLRSGVMRPNILAAQKLGNAAHDDLIGMLRSATPAGRVISLCLLKRINPAHFAQYNDQLRSESGNLSVSYISPSERCHYTVNDILSDLASTKPTIKVVY